MMKKPDRSLVLTADLWKFVYSWFIVYFHFYLSTSLHFPGGKFGVEFFLLVAGVFFFRHLDRETAEIPPRYLIHRFMRFFPWALTGFIFAFLVIRLYVNGTTSFHKLADCFSTDIWEILLVKMNGINNNTGLLNSPAWTLSSMLLVEIVLVGCYSSCRKTFVNVLLPLSLIIGFGCWRHLKSAGSSEWIGFTTFGTLRTWLIYGCAYYCYHLSSRLRRIDFSRRGRFLLTALETLCHIFAIWAMLRQDTRNWQWCVLLAFFIAVAITMSGHSLWNTALQKCSRMIRFLGSLSLSVYLVHWPVIRFFRTVYPDNDAQYAHVAVVTGAIFVCALAHYFITTGLIHICRLAKPKLAAVFVKTPDGAA